VRAWIEISAECNWCGREVDAIAVYVEPLDGEER
jgi:hypothetical protein